MGFDIFHFQNIYSGTGAYTYYTFFILSLILCVCVYACVYMVLFGMPSSLLLFYNNVIVNVCVERYSGMQTFIVELFFKNRFCSRSLLTLGNRFSIEFHFIFNLVRRIESNELNSFSSHSLFIAATYSYAAIAEFRAHKQTHNIESVWNKFLNEIKSVALFVSFLISFEIFSCFMCLFRHSFVCLFVRPFVSVDLKMNWQYL